MKRLLIVSPHFPPVNAPDLHRVRLCLPYYRDLGWEVTVLACEPDPVTNQSFEPLLAESIPAGTEVIKVTALRPLPGLRNLSWRSWRSLAKRGDVLMQRRRFDLVFFSTTQFASMTLGPRWKNKFQVPFVCDIQDPWVNTFYDRHPDVPRPGGWKHHIVQRLARILESRTLRHAAGLIAVSQNYLTEIDERLPVAKRVPRIVLPFGADERDWVLADDARSDQRLFSPRVAGFGLNLVSVGRGGADLRPALLALIDALAGANEASKVPDHLHLIGTSYAENSRARPIYTLPPEAQPWVTEVPSRQGYYRALRCLRDADVVVVLGSRDPGYQPSKLHVAISSGRPVVALVWPRSGLEKSATTCDGVRVIRLTVDGRLSEDERAESIRWIKEIQQSRPATPLPPRMIEPEFHARNLTCRQIKFFEKLLVTRGSNPADADKSYRIR